MSVDLLRKSRLSGKKTNSVLASSSKVVETLNTSKFDVLKYFLIFSNPTKTIKKSMELTILNQGIILKDTVSNRIGTGLDLEVGAILNSPNMELTITNNEIFDINVSLVKLTI